MKTRSSVLRLKNTTFKFTSLDPKTNYATLRSHTLKRCVNPPSNRRSSAPARNNKKLSPMIQSVETPPQFGEALSANNAMKEKKIGKYIYIFL